MKRLASLIVLAAALSASGLAQNPAPPGGPEFFRLDFNLKETDGGKVVNTRAYQMMVRAEDPGTSSIRSGGRVPVAGDKGFTYVDVGVNLDVKRLVPSRSSRDEATMDIVAEVSGTLELGEPKASPAALPPTVRQTRFNSTVLVPLRKPTVLFSSEDPTTRRQLQLEVTATPIR